MREKSISLISMTGAAFMIAHQVAGKAVRDSFFLSNHPISDLPKVVMAAAVLSMIFVLLSARLMKRCGPARVVPVGFFLSAGLHIVEYFAVRQAADIWSLVIYFHIVALGAILLSGFWSLMAETFDPRTARQLFGRIAGIGTLGGICGGILAERAAALFQPVSVLMLLTIFHLLCAAVLATLRRATAASEAAAASPGDELNAPLELFRRAPYLGWIALTVIVGTSSAAILDYLFKEGASQTFQGEAQLLRFFLIFNIGIQILTFLAQTFLARRVLNHKGIGSSLSTLPLGVGIGALGALLAPLFPVFAIARSLEFILRGSLYRSAYELLYIPVPPDEKRAAKTLIDVACDRAGDAIGGGIVQLFIWTGLAFAPSGLMGVTLALACAGIWASLHLDIFYKKLVQERLLHRAGEFALDGVDDFTTRSAFISVLQQAPAAASASTVKIPVAAPPPETDPVMLALRELRSGEATRILQALATLESITPLIATQLLRLLAWDEVSGPVRQALLRSPLYLTGMLIDHLVNPNVEFGIRRRVPSILSHCQTSLAAAGLLIGLGDTRFEVRFQCARALDALAQRYPTIKVTPARIFAAAERELKIAGPLRQSHKLLDKRSENDQDAYLDEVLRERANQSLEYIFSLFAVVLPREPVKTAFRALHTQDRGLRGLALEYLHSVLPEAVHEHLMRLLEEPGVMPRDDSGVNGQKALDELIRSHESLLLQLEKFPAPARDKA